MRSQADDQRSPRNPLRFLGKLAIAIPLLVVIVPLALLVVIAWFAFGIVLTLVIWVLWCRRGVYTLLVHSESPIWRGYIDEHLLPRLPKNTVILNWSERRRWRWHSFAVIVFRYFGGSREFNPLVIVFHPFRRPRTFRFWKPFKDFKHGNTASLEKLQGELLDYVADGRQHPPR